MDGYVFEGFARTSSASRDDFVECADAFIFSLHRPGGAGPVKLALREGHTGQALLDFAMSGPNFGGMHIALEEVADIVAKNYTNLISYELPPGHPPVDAKAFFTGSEYFRAAEVEVFSVIV